MLTETNLTYPILRRIKMSNIEILMSLLFWKKIWKKIRKKDMKKK